MISKDKIIENISRVLRTVNISGYGAKNRVK